MYWKRHLSKILKQAMEQFPAVLITGPRQSGKTTFLLNELKSNSDYITFDDPLERQYAQSDPKGFLERFKKKHVVLDEIQYVPELFLYIKMNIDTNRSSGKFIMTGPQQFHMMKNISESLAGRVAILQLLPFSFNEIEKHTEKTIENLIWTGSYPAVAVNPSSRDLWIQSYIHTYVERDIRQLQEIKNLKLFETYLSLAAANHSQELNHNALSGKCGISQPTSKEWQTLLEASFIIYALQPYYSNFGKRLIRSSKLYFLDSSIPAYLTRQPSPEALWAGSMGGSFFEGWVISETVKFFTSRGMKPPIYFWRSHDGMEVDLIIESNNKLHSAEIKQNSTPMPRHSESLIKFRNLIGEKLSGNQALICTVSKKTLLPGNIQAINWTLLTQWLNSCIVS